MRIIIECDDNSMVIQAIENLRGELMEKMNQFQEALSSVDQETTRIGAYIERLVEKLDSGGLTDAQEEEVLAGLRAAGERLRLVGSSPTAPVPEGELPKIEE